MGRRGPKSDPLNLTLLKGNPGKRSTTDNRPHPDVGVGDPPDWLDKVATEHWKELAPILERCWMVAETDRWAFTMLCHAWSQWRAASDEAANHPRIMTSATGFTRVSGYVNYSRDCLKSYLSLSSKFGLTPADRANIRTV
jgi:P27 family predicted phage terminase small subunit